MSNVIGLADRRTTPETEGRKPAVCVECGGQWFELRPNHPQMPEHGALTLRVDGTVSGYAGVPHCVGCGVAWLGNSGR